jgi:SPX domain protein involved in polyphosphate accumulation
VAGEDKSTLSSKITVVYDTMRLSLLSKVSNAVEPAAKANRGAYNHSSFSSMSITSWFFSKFFCSTSLRLCMSTSVVLALALPLFSV